MKFIVLALLFCACFAFEGFDPIANPDAIIVLNRARFTVLTPYVIRVEYSELETPKFHDEPSFAILNRNLDVPKFTKELRSDFLKIETDALVLEYNATVGIVTDPAALKITMKLDQKVEWHFGMANPGRLNGAIRTLDGVNGSTGMDCTRESWDSDNFCEKGVISRNGWTIIVDDRRPRFTDNSEWMWTEGVIPEAYDKDDKQLYHDFYFFGHGYNYKQALKDYTTLSGPIPIIPKYSLGSWYCKYHAWTETDLREIILEDFATAGVPIDMMVIDMDFHKSYDHGFPNPYNVSVNGWSGFTWYDAEFPSPSHLMNYMKQRNIYTTLNTHPAGGIQFYEEFYKEMAIAMGYDPEKGETVPWNITDLKYAENLFKIILQPFHDRGMEFWWIDYQQGETTTYRNVNPTFWTDYTWFTSKTRWSNEDRPFIMGRFGGLGSHRYPIGFSGDATTSWETLKFQPEFEIYAANVAYQWGHDLGGHNPNDGVEKYPELNTRWIQLGLWSHSLRTHSTKWAKEHAFFAFPDPYAKFMKRDYRLRERLVPYLYKSSVEAYETGLSYIRGLYYEDPLSDNAYKYNTIYMFGDDIVVAPVLDKSWSDLHDLAVRDIYLPEGTYYDFKTGLKNYGGIEYSMNFTLSETPVYAKEGSIIPMMELDNNKLEGAASRSPEMMLFNVYPIDDNQIHHTWYIDDQGKNTDIYKGNYYKTNVDYEQIDSTHIRITINPVEGDGYEGALESRAYRFRLFNQYPAASVTVNDEEFKYNVYGVPNEFGESHKWSGNEYGYEGKTFSIWINTLTKYDIHKPVEVIITLQSERDSHLDYPVYRMIYRTKVCKEALLTIWGQVIFEDYPNLMKLSTISTLFELNNNADDIKKTVDQVYKEFYPQALEEMYNLTTKDAKKQMCIDLVQDGIVQPPKKN
ncbi:hypothetical protein WA158_000588 [Blastocystis sp. Blastoise]